MEQYHGINCPICGKPLEDGREIAVCPECGGKMILKFSRRGRFWGCSNYPNCKHVEKFDKNEVNN